MEHSSGLAIIYKDQILLVHPTNGRWYGTYSIPKGHVDAGETNIEAAIRETKEEIGIDVPRELIGPEMELFYIKTKTGKPWKKLTYYIVPIKSLDRIGLKSETIPKSQLQAAEVDWAGFMPFQMAKPRMIKAHLEILEHI